MEELYNDSDSQLIPFLRELANSIESGEANREQLKCIGEFYMSYKFFEKREGWTDVDIQETEDMDFVKFVTMGWWMYTQILKDEKDENIQK
jgi:hypothetical protein